MSTLKVFNTAGQTAGEKTVEDGILILDRGQQAVKDTVVAIMNGWRAGTASTKTKAEVSGSGKKPWKQKGTGRASFGTTRNPVWKGGGVAFGPRPRDFSQKINKKVAALAFGRALSDKVANGELVVVDNLVFDQPKTKLAVAMLKNMGFDRSCLIVVGNEVDDTEVNDNFFYAAGNLPRVAMSDVCGVDVYMLCRFKNIVVTASALEALLARIPNKAED